MGRTPWPGPVGVPNGVLVGVLDGLPAVLAEIDVSGFVEADLAVLLGQVRVVQRCLDGLVMRIGSQCDRLAGEGRAAPAEELARGGGTVGARQARRDAVRAQLAGTVDGLSEAISAGEVGGEHVDSIARHTAKLDEDRRDGFDFAGLVNKAKELPVETFDRLVKRRVDQANTDHGLNDTIAKQAASEFRHWYDQNTGMGQFAGSLDLERYEALTGAVEQQMAAIAARSDEGVTKNRNLAARALVELATAGGGSDTRNRLPYITVVVDHDTVVHGNHDRTVCQTENGHDLPIETVARLCCDAVIRRVTLDSKGIPVDVGRKYRTATDAQWAAIKAVHASCAWEGCDAPINWCQAHHIREWDNGGPTNLNNLVPLCSRHHHRVHEGQWTIKMLPDRTLKIHKPDSTHYQTVPTPHRWRPQSEPKGTEHDT